MKKVLLVLVAIGISFSAAHGKDVHSFYCDDSDNGALVANPAGKTQFTWTKNDTQIFDRTFTDAFSASRNKYVTFYCQNDIIRYRLFECTEPSVRPYCAGSDNPVSVKLEIEQRRVETSQTLIDGNDYKFITHYMFKSLSGNPIAVTGLAFVTDVDETETLTASEVQAATQYLYTLVGPNGALISDVSTDNGKLYFDLSDNPIMIGGDFENLGIAAKAKENLGTDQDSGIRWVLDNQFQQKGVAAALNNQALAYGEASLSASRSTIFSRGISGLKIDHFGVQNLIESPQTQPQAFYRLRVENIADKNASQLRRMTLEMRAIGMEKTNGAFLEASDFSIVEIGPDASEIGVPANQFFVIPDSRNDSKAMTIQIELANFLVPAADSRGLEFRIANLVNDEAGKSDDDGVAIQLVPERTENGAKTTLSQLNEAAWVWTDFSGSALGADRNDWRSGVNLDVNTRPIIIRE